MRARNTITSIAMGLLAASCGSDGGDDSTTDGEGPECSSGPCCDTEAGTFLEQGAICEEWTEHQCSSGDCGADAMSREAGRTCTGSSAGCDGETVFSAWTVVEPCAAAEACESSAESAQCLVCGEHGCLDGNCWDGTVKQDQEEAMCSALSASTYKDVTAGPTIADSGAMDAQPGRKRVTLADFQGQKGGYVRLSLNPANETPVFALVLEDTPFAVVHEDESPASLIASGAGSALCPEAHGRYLWRVSGTTNYLVLGPTASQEINMSLEVVKND